MDGTAPAMPGRTLSLRALAASLQPLRVEVDLAVGWRLATTALLIVAGALLSALAPLALKDMVDETGRIHGLADQATWDRSLAFASAYLLALVLGRLMAEFRTSFVGAAEQRLYARLRKRYFAHLLNLPLSFHLERQTGALGQTLQQAITGYQILIFSLVTSVAPVLVELSTVTLVLASLAQSALTAAFAGIAIAYLAVMRFRLHEIKDAARGISDASMDAHAMLADCLLNVETLKCFGAEPRAGLRLDKAANTLEGRWTAFRQARLRAGLNVTAAFALAITAVLAIALHGVLDGTLSMGGFVLANAYLFQVVRPLEMLGNAMRDMAQAVEFVRPLRIVLAEPVEERRTLGRAHAARFASALERQAATPAPPGASGICFQDVHFRYRSGPAVLNGINLDIADGRTVAIVGASGSGKSSVVRLLTRLYEPRAGTIFVDGVDIVTLPVDELRSLMAVVPQDTVLFNASMAFNIGIAKADATPQDIERAARLAQLHEFIALLPAGYETMVGERGLKLSGGQRQRIAIARAVLKDPRIYVFDEATSMLDSATERDLLRSVRQVSARATTITIAHRLSTIQDADEIVVLDGGRFVERGDHAALMALDGRYACAWRAQHGRRPA